MERKSLGSYNRLGGKIGVSPETVRRLVLGIGRSDDATMRKVATALDVPITRIREWAATAVGTEKPFELPPEASRLSPRQQDAVLSVVRAMLEPVESRPHLRSVDRSRPAPQARDTKAARRGESHGKRERGDG